MKAVIISVLLFVHIHASTKKGLGCDRKCNANLINQMGVYWWYNWQARPHVSSPVQFVPMVFSLAKLGDVPPYSTHLLGMNQPNLRGETVEQIADVWPGLVSKAGTIGSPAQSGNPYRDNSWLQQFVNYRTKPQFNFVALHSYNGYNPDTFKELINNVTKKFNKPIWITEFACQDNADSTSKPFNQTVVNHFIDTVIPFLENHGNVLRYAWHSADAGTSALWTANGELTETGKRYANAARLNSLKAE